MKKIEWHNPANATPPEGYRLLIPEEVDGGRIKGVLVLTIFKKWVESLAMFNDTYNPDCTYAVPQDTPLPEGYAVIDGEPWELNGWTLNVPGVTRTDHLDGNTCVEVIYRNTVTSGGSKKYHYFGAMPEDPGAEIIGWRVVEQEEAPETKPMTATEIMEQRYPKDRAADRAWAATQQMAQQLEDFRTVLDENQRLKKELADARATLALTHVNMTEMQGALLVAHGELVKTKGYLQVRINDGQQVYSWLEEVSGGAEIALKAITKSKQILNP